MRPAGETPFALAFFLFVKEQARASGSVADFPLRNEKGHRNVSYQVHGKRTLARSREAGHPAPRGRQLYTMGRGGTGCVCV